MANETVTEEPGIFDFITKPITDIYNNVVNGADNLVNDVTGAFTSLKDTAVKEISDLISILNPMTYLKNGIDDMKSAIMGPLIEIMRSVFDWVDSKIVAITGNDPDFGKAFLAKMEEIAAPAVADPAPVINRANNGLAVRP